MAEWTEGKRMLAWADRLNLRLDQIDLLADQIRSVVASNDPGYNFVADILEYIAGRQPVLAGAFRSSADHEFYQNIVRLREATPTRGAPRLECGPEFDTTIRRQATAPTVGELCNIVAMSQIAPTKRFAVLATARDDGPYLVEWLAHHRVLGIEHFFLYSNDNSDGSDELLESLMDNGVITYVRNKLGPTVHPSIKSYTHALHFVPEFRDYEWVFVLDSDEFVHLDVSLDELVRRADAAAAGFSACIMLNWRWLGSNVLRFSDRL